MLLLNILNESIRFDFKNDMIKKKRRPQMSAASTIIQKSNNPLSQFDQFFNYFFSLINLDQYGICSFWQTTNINLS
jgi:hypothetical protein